MNGAMADLVYSFGVIHHTPSPESVLKEIRKYMAPSSTVKIMVYIESTGQCQQAIRNDSPSG